MPAPPAPPAAKGTYALFFLLDQPLTLPVGRWGLVTLPAGWLVYVGSALGPGGLRARLRRHLTPHKRAHWHIDWLTLVHPPDDWLVRADGQRRECDWVQWLAAWPHAQVPLPGFGSSDCHRGCPAHLLAFPPDQDPRPWMRDTLGATPFPLSIS